VLAHCRGEFLAGWDQEWCLYERARLEEARLSGLEQLIQWCEARELFVKGLDFGRQVLAVSPARETTHRLLMRVHHLAGDRSAVVRQFQQCASALREEFGVAPSPVTARLYQQICTDDGSTTTLPGHHDPVRDDAFAGVRAQLDQIQAALDTLTCFVRERAAPRAGRPGRPSIPAAESA
jgi:DNA-binding SARP family transcriptional activator